MMTRVILFLVFILFTSGCNAEKQDSPSTAIASKKDVEVVFESFSKAVSEKNVDLFIDLSDPKGVHLVRKFTSGNLGGRGPELSELTDPKKINEKLQFPIENQTSYSIRIQFQELPFKSFSDLSNRPLSEEVENMHFDTWGVHLKESLTGSSEAEDRLPIMLTSANSKYYVYAEAQIIDEILVGGFAVFSMVDGKLKLVALIELL